MGVDEGTRGTHGFLLCSSSFSLKFLNQVLVHKSLAIPDFVTDLSKAMAHPVHKFRIVLDSKKKTTSDAMSSWGLLRSELGPLSVQSPSCSSTKAFLLFSMTTINCCSGIWLRSRG